MKRFFSCLIVLTMLLSAFAGCGETPASSDGGETTAAPSQADAETEAPETETQYVPDSLPDDLDYGGAAFRVFGWSGPVLVEFYVEEQNGEIVNDAIYDRNLAVEERLDVSLEYHLEPG